MSNQERVDTPGSDGEPVMEWVLPLPVMPYANMHRHAKVVEDALLAGLSAVDMLKVELFAVFEGIVRMLQPYSPAVAIDSNARVLVLRALLLAQRPDSHSDLHRIADARLVARVHRHPPFQAFISNAAAISAVVNRCVNEQAAAVVGRSERRREHTTTARLNTPHSKSVGVAD
eukprot:746070-Rhodomonas_salina.2